MTKLSYKPGNNEERHLNIAKSIRLSNIYYLALTSCVGIRNRAGLTADTPHTADGSIYPSNMHVILDCPVVCLDLGQNRDVQ